MTAGESRPRRAGETVLAALFFLAATVVLTWPQAAHLSDGMTDLWDAKLNLRIVDWDYHQTFRNPLELFQLNFFHPARYVLAFSENLYGAALFGFPLFALGASPVFVYNFLLLLGMFLSALAAWALARYFTDDPLASLAAGLVYAFVPWRFSQLPHMQHQWGAFLCLSLLFLLRYLDEGKRRDAVLFGVCLAWNAIANVHFALFSGFVVAAAVGLWAAQRPPDLGRRLRGTLAAAVLGGFAFAPFAIPYRKATELYGMQRYFSEMATFSGRWSDFLSAGEKNRLYGPLTAAWRHAEGDFFPGIAALALAAYAIWKLWGRPQVAPPEALPSAARRRAARVLDVVVLGVGAVWIAARLRPGLSLGPVGLGDTGRVQVWLTIFALARLVLGFPRGGRYASLGDFLRRGPLSPRLALLLALAAAGLLVALGGNTPYYRFLFQSFGAIFRAVRAPSRGIVLFDLALAVLAAWGLSLATRRLGTSRRLAWTAALVIVMVGEYRAFPLDVHPVQAQAPPVYQWLKGVDLPGAVVEWPLGPNDTEYLFRQTAHDKPLVNGYSGFFPKPYDALQATLRQRPIPDTVWKEMADLGTSLVIFHPWDGGPLTALATMRLIRRGLEEGKLEILASFPGGGGRDFVFRLATAPRFDARVPRTDAEEAAKFLKVSDAEIAPPFGALDAPVEGAEVTPGFWAFGWALDDSGIEEVRVETELGPVGSALVHMRHPGLGAGYPEYADAEFGGYGFSLPALAPGLHRLTVTFVANDGGRATIQREIRVVAALPTSPTPGAHGH